MISLFLDTSANYLNIALFKDEVILDSFYERLNNNLSKITLLKIDEMLKKGGYDKDDVSKIICVNGPGSFTGLRIGITIAKTYAYSLNKKLYSLSKLYVMASSIKKSVYKVPYIDARRSFVYAAIYDKDNNLILDEQYISIESLKDKISKLSGDVIFVSEEDNYLFENEKEYLKYSPNLNPRDIYNKMNEESAFLMVPNYLKSCEAEENLKNK